MKTNLFGKLFPRYRAPCAAQGEERKKRRRLDAALGGGLLLAMLLSPLAGFGQQCAQVRQEVLRLHILANSDSPEDQALKLRVRDAVLLETGDLFSAAGTLEDARLLAEENLPAIEETARRVLAENGCRLPVRAELTRMYFNTRQYDRSTLPAGEYDALRLTIGEAQGKNWWCVMFPPLCIPAAATAEEGEAPEALRDIQILNEEPHYRLAFASVEWVEECLDALSFQPEEDGTPR